MTREEREARLIAQPILDAEVETQKGLDEQVKRIVEEHEVKRRDTPEQAEQKTNRAAQALAVALLAYLLLRRRKASEAGVESVARNLGILGVGAASARAITQRVLAMPTERPVGPLRRAVERFTDRFTRGALVRIDERRAVTPPPLARIVPGVPARPTIIRPVVRPREPGAARPDLAGALERARKTTEPGLTRIVAVETWEQANAEIGRAHSVAAIVEPEAMREWVATLDMRTCPVCRSLDGKRIPADQDFDIEPPVHPYCRCLVILTYGAGTR